MQTKENTTYGGVEELLLLESMKNYNQAIVKDSLKNISGSDKILDFGAGIGTLSNIFRSEFKKDPICIEIDNLNISYLKKRNLKYQKSLKDLSYKFDLIFSSNVLEHIQDDFKILLELREYLNDNGNIYLYLPAKMILGTKLDQIVGHYRRYEINSLKNLCKKTGYKIKQIHYADCAGFFTTLIWKILNKFIKKSLPSKSALIFYDRFIFPVSRFLDQLGFKYIIGKNIILIAQKDN